MLATLKRRDEFLHCARGIRIHTALFVLQARAARLPQTECRIGYTVIKKTGTAPERNRIRRRLRAALGAVAAEGGIDSIGPAFDMVIVAQRALLSVSFSLLRETLASAIESAAKRVAKAGASRGGTAPGDGLGKAGPLTKPLAKRAAKRHEKRVLSPPDAEQGSPE